MSGQKGSLMTWFKVERLTERGCTRCECSRITEGMNEYGRRGLAGMTIKKTPRGAIAAQEDKSRES